MSFHTNFDLFLHTQEYWSFFIPPEYSQLNVNGLHMKTYLQVHKPVTYRKFKALHGSVILEAVMTFVKLITVEMLCMN
jgi:hypothetical protein